MSAAPATKSGAVTPAAAAVLARRFGPKVTVEPRPASDVPTIATDPGTLPELARFLRDDPSSAFDLFLDVAALDRLRLETAAARSGAPRFSASYLLYSTRRNEHLRVRVDLPESNPTLPSLTPVWEGANWPEREAWDLMGFQFPGHPNLKRLLTHDGFVGHALRKDYEPGQRWMCTEEDLLQTELAAQTDVSEDVFESTTLNFGPSHPAMHGTLRTVMRIDGERIVAAESECGYLHRCFEKMSETHTWNQVIPYCDRLNYCSPMLNGNSYALAVEKMLGVEVPPRANAVRIVTNEFSRIMDHLVCIGANLVDIGALTNFWYAFQPREEIYSLLEACCGARLTSSYARVGGFANDVPENFAEWSLALLPKIRERMADVDGLITKNRIAMSRLKDTGAVTKEQALAWGFTGKDAPYSGYDELDFDVPIATDGDNYARYLVRMEEMRQSMRMIEQVCRKLPGGPINSDDYRVVLPPKEMVYNEMEGLIYHFKLVFEGIKVPPGEIYHFTEGGNGELGYHIWSDGSGFPYRVKVRGPCFQLFAAFEKMIRGAMVSDAIATIGTLNIIAGELDR